MRFGVDGTLIQAWAGHKSFVRKDGSADDGDNANFKDKRRGNDKKKMGQKNRVRPEWHSVKPNTRKIMVIHALR